MKRIIYWMMLLIVATGCDNRMEVTADMDAPSEPD